MNGKPINIDGIEIPSDSPLFLTLIAIHVLAAMICVIAGLIAMLSKKQRGNHSSAGTIYFYGLIVVFATVTLISILRWKEDYYLFILGLMSFASAFIGLMAARRKWRRWPLYHLMGMGFSYIILITAFYVDNGRFLPVWKNFNPIVYWILPSSVGVPIMVFALMRHPIVRNKLI